MLAKYKKIAILLSVTIIAVGCSSTLGIKPAETRDPCSPSEVVKYIESLDEVYQQFEETYEQARSTPKKSLYVKVEKLQSIQRKAENVDVPYCAETAKSYLIEYMEHTNDGFSGFLYGDSEEDYLTSFVIATLRQSYYTGTMDELRQLADP
jgi:hypothetical protein